MTSDSVQKENTENISADTDSTPFLNAIRERNTSLLEELAFAAGYEKRIHPPTLLSERWPKQDSRNACATERDLYERLIKYEKGFTRVKQTDRRYFVDCCYRRDEFLFAAGVFPERGDASYCIGLSEQVNDLLYLENVREKQPFLSMGNIFFGKTYHDFIGRLMIPLIPGTVWGIVERSVSSGIGMGFCSATLVCGLYAASVLERGKAAWKNDFVVTEEEAVISLLEEIYHTKINAASVQLP